MKIYRNSENGNLLHCKVVVHFTDINFGPSFHYNIAGQKLGHSCVHEPVKFKQWMKKAVKISHEQNITST